MAGQRSPRGCVQEWSLPALLGLHAQASDAPPSPDSFLHQLGRDVRARIDAAIIARPPKRVPWPGVAADAIPAVPAVGVHGAQTAAAPTRARSSWVGNLVVRAIGTWQRRVARARGVVAPKTGAAMFVQRFTEIPNHAALKATPT